MKDKNLPNDYNSLTLEELTQEANKMIKDLENQKDLKNAVENYQTLLKLNNIIENWRDGYVPEPEAEPEPEIESQELTGFIAINEDLRPSLTCLLYTSPSPRDLSTSRMPSSA